MQSLQLHLTGAARSWLNTLPDDSIGSWGELENQFTRNFRSTYKRPASIEEVKSCIQRKGEALCSYIQRWSIIKNSAEDVSDEQAVDAFASGLRHSGLVEELGRTKPKMVLELIEIANRFAYGEDAYHSKRARSPEFNAPGRQCNQRRRSRNKDGRARRNQIAAGYEKRDEEGDEDEEYHKKDKYMRENPKYSDPSAEVSWEFRDSSHGVAYRGGSTVVTMGPARDCANGDTSVYPGSGPSRVEVKPVLPACFVLTRQ
jgi:hypothetical protein